MTRRRHRWTRRERQTLAAIAAVVFVFGAGRCPQGQQLPVWCRGPGGGCCPVIVRRGARGLPLRLGRHRPVRRRLGLLRAGAGRTTLNAGITIPRTSEEQWTTGPQVPHPAAR